MTRATPPNQDPAAVWALYADDLRDLLRWARRARARLSDPQAVAALGILEKRVLRSLAVVDPE